ncbi:hypothetical protein [Gayadomonas joobiniege]|uniref:hypothetical protein n=1 Tax=Gayadomonas joobiniege TaxID=1234606 RepID=UPI000376115A|nr:hypothetical protein [Gayadomonas joobiniege]
MFVRIILFVLYFISASLSSIVTASEKAVELAFDNCQTQMERIFKTQVDCTVQYDAMQNKEVSAILAPFASSLNCKLPLKFNKKEVYGNWIQENLISLPKLAMQCQLTGKQGEVFSLTSNIKPVCDNASGRWLCNLNVHNTQGLGALGEILQNALNKNTNIQEYLGRQVASMK